MSSNGANGRPPSEGVPKPVWGHSSHAPSASDAAATASAIAAIGALTVALVVSFQTQNATELRLRAYIEAVSAETTLGPSGSVGRVTFKVENIGQTPARRLKVTCVAEYIPWLNVPASALTGQAKVLEPMAAAGAGACEAVPAPQERTNGAPVASPSIVGVVDVAYDDVFAHHHALHAVFSSDGAVTQPGQLQRKEESYQD